MSVLSERIKERRQSVGLTLLQIAEKLGVKEATVQRYESGEIKNIKHETIVELAAILNCSPAYLMGWEENPQTSNTIQEQTHIHKYRSIDDKGKHTVDTVLDMEYNRCVPSQDTVKSLGTKKKYIPTEEDIRSLVARNGKRLTREEAIDVISTLFSDDDE